MCDFPSRQLLLARRTVAKELPMRDALPLILMIDERRYAHEEQTGCQCWYDERKKLEEIKPC